MSYSNPFDCLGEKYENELIARENERNKAKNDLINTLSTVFNTNPIESDDKRSYCRDKQLLSRHIKTPQEIKSFAEIINEEEELHTKLSKGLSDDPINPNTGFEKVVNITKRFYFHDIKDQHKNLDKNIPITPSLSEQEMFKRYRELPGWVEDFNHDPTNDDDVHLLCRYLINRYPTRMENHIRVWLDAWSACPSKMRAMYGCFVIPLKLLVIYPESTISKLEYSKQLYKDAALNEYDYDIDSGENYNKLPGYTNDLHFNPYCDRDINLVCGLLLKRYPTIISQRVRGWLHRWKTIPGVMRRCYGKFKLPEQLLKNVPEKKLSMYDHEMDLYNRYPDHIYLVPTWYNDKTLVNKGLYTKRAASNCDIRHK